VTSLCAPPVRCLAVFRDYDPHFVARSMDEAYLDITEACLERGLTGAQGEQATPSLSWPHLSCCAPCHVLAGACPGLEPCGASQRMAWYLECRVLGILSHV